MTSVSWLTDPFDDAPDIVAQVCKHLKLYETFYPRLVTDTVAYVEYNHRIFVLSDNGGEINVQLVNVWDTPISVASTAHMRKVHPGEVAYRVRRAMDGEEIDYDWRWPNEWDDLLKEFIS